MMKDEKDMQALAEIMEQNWINPLKPDEADSVSLSMAAVVHTDVANDLINAHTLVVGFADRGNLIAFNLLKADATYQEAVAQLWQSWEVAPELFNKV